MNRMHLTFKIHLINRLYRIAILNGLISLFVVNTYAGVTSLRFEHITIEDGLSHSKVNTILQDSRGFMWFGTNDGLNRYDGYEIVEYQRDIDDPHSLSHNLIRDIFEDSKGRLWIATDAGGLNLYDRDHDCFIRFRHDPNDPFSVSSNNINEIAEDKNHNLWFATRNGLNRLEPDSGKFYHYLHDPEYPAGPGGAEIQTLLIDSMQNIWLGLRGSGIELFNIDRETHTHYRYDPDDPGSLKDKDILSMSVDSHNNLWIGTNVEGLGRFDEAGNRFIHYANFYNMKMPAIRAIFERENGDLWIGSRMGLFVYDPIRRTIQHFTHEEKDSHSLIHPSVLCIYKDRAGHIWLGTRGGICYFNSNVDAFHHYIPIPNDPHRLNCGVVYSLYEDSRGKLWVGTETGGINILDRETDLFSYIMHKPGNQNSLTNNNIKAIMEDRYGDFWIGTFARGVTRYNPFTKQFRHYRHDPSNPFSLSNNDVYSIVEDGKSDLWFASHRGISRLDRASERFINYLHDPEDENSLSNNDCKTIFIDKSGTIWIGTFRGLNRFVPQTGQFIRYMHGEKDSTSLSCSFIEVMYEDSKNRFWVGTQGGGLNLFDRETGKTIAYTRKEGLPSSSVYGILEDDHGRLWCSTNSGIFRFDPQSEEIKIFDVTDGLQSDQFNYKAFFRSPSGEMFFGGMNGFNAFFPDSIRQETFVPPVVITDFKIANQSVSIGEPDSPLSKHVSETDHIILYPEQSIITFKFAVLNYTASQKNQYAYRLEGFEDDWNYVGTQRTATYTNLPPGTYRFQVKGANNHGYWNEVGTSIYITKKPPFYQTSLFRIVAVLSIVFGVIFLYRLRVAGMMKRTRDLKSMNLKLNKHIKQRKQAEKRIQNQLAEKEILLKEIHHRVKNNLQIIVSLLRLQSGSVDNAQMKEILKESRERVRSMALVHEKLYHTEKLADIDFSEYIRNLVEELSKAYRSDNKVIDINLECESVSLEIDYAVPCGLVVNELISNAMKHAFPDERKEKGNIHIILKKNGNQVELEVADNGVGLSSEFNPREADSLGLKLIYILVEDQLGGRVELNLEKGTAFKILFRLK